MAFVKVLTFFALLAVVTAYGQGGSLRYSSVFQDSPVGYHNYGNHGYGHYNYRHHGYQNYANHGHGYGYGALSYSNLVKYNNHYAHGYTGHGLNHGYHELVYAGHSLNYDHRNFCAHKHDYHHVRLKLGASGIST
ncbi:histidine-rich glycoprotein-like [Ctenocephalides felis]|uniref:histidine-rich glycoprotein-like n=1 Tax=Ctenocephalides felis TaxID=7515 RepID=UPI000E6E435B|nr:histidine-rich glycoprotein-like [Ctenocephalides felis]